MRGFDAHGRLFALTACLPEADVVDQRVGSGVNALLAFTGTPHLDAVLDEPLYQKRRLIFASAEAVEHEHQQHVELLLFGQCPDFDNSVAVIGGYLVAGHALFHAFIVEYPIVHSFDERHAFAALHGNIVSLIDLSFCRNSVQA